MEDYISLDIETTGLDPKKDKIIEIGAVKIVNGVIVETFCSYVNPGRKLPEKIIEITGIQDEDLKTAPVIQEVIKKLQIFLEDYVLLGHSILFDYSFLKKAFINERLSFEKKGVDTLRIARAYLPELESRRLSALCQHFQIEHNAHRALEDAKATHFLYEKMVELYEKGDEGGLFVPIPLQYQVKKEGPITKAQMERLKALLIQHKITPDYKIEMLTKNEASRIMDHMYAEYGR